MKEYNIKTKEGQRRLLESFIVLEKLGYEEGEEELKIYNDGYIQALKDILGVDYQRFICDGKVFTNK